MAKKVKPVKTEDDYVDGFDKHLKKLAKKGKRYSFGKVEESKEFPGTTYFNFESGTGKKMNKIIESYVKSGVVVIDPTKENAYRIVMQNTVKGINHFNSNPNGHSVDDIIHNREIERVILKYFGDYVSGGTINFSKIDKKTFLDRYNKFTKEMTMRGRLAKARDNAAKSDPEYVRYKAGNVVATPGLGVRTVDAIKDALGTGKDVAKDLLEEIKDNAKIAWGAAKGNITYKSPLLKALDGSGKMPDYIVSSTYAKIAEQISKMNTDIATNNFNPNSGLVTTPPVQTQTQTQTQNGPQQQSAPKTTQQQTQNVPHQNIPDNTTEKMGAREDQVREGSEITEEIRKQHSKEVYDQIRREMLEEQIAEGLITPDELSGPDRELLFGKQEEMVKQPEPVREQTSTTEGPAFEYQMDERNSDIHNIIVDSYGPQNDMSDNNPPSGGNPPQPTEPANEEEVEKLKSQVKTIKNIREDGKFGLNNDRIEEIENDLNNGNLTSEDVKKLQSRVADEAKRTNNVVERVASVNVDGNVSPYVAKKIEEAKKQQKELNGIVEANTPKQPEVEQTPTEEVQETETHTNTEPSKDDNKPNQEKVEKLKSQVETIKGIRSNNTYGLSNDVLDEISKVLDSEDLTNEKVEELQKEVLSQAQRTNNVVSNIAKMDESSVDMAENKSKVLQKIADAKEFEKQLGEIIIDNTPNPPSNTPKQPVSSEMDAEDKDIEDFLDGIPDDFGFKITESEQEEQKVPVQNEPQNNDGNSNNVVSEENTQTQEGEKAKKPSIGDRLRGIAGKIGAGIEDLKEQMDVNRQYRQAERQNKKEEKEAANKIKEEEAKKREAERQEEKEQRKEERQQRREERREKFNAFVENVSNKVRETVDDITTEIGLKAQEMKDRRADRIHEKNEKAMERAAKKAARIAVRQQKREERREAFQGWLKNTKDKVKRTTAEIGFWFDTKFGKNRELENTNDAIVIEDNNLQQSTHQDMMDEIDKQRPVEPEKPKHPQLPNGIANMAADCMWKYVGDNLLNRSDVDLGKHADVVRLASGKKIDTPDHEKEAIELAEKTLKETYKNAVLDNPEKYEKEMAELGVETQGKSQEEIAEAYANAKMQKETANLTPKGLARVCVKAMSDRDVISNDNGSGVTTVTYDENGKQKKEHRTYHNKNNPVADGMDKIKSETGFSFDNPQPFVDAVIDQVNQSWPTQGLVDVLSAGEEGVHNMPTPKKETVMDDMGNPKEVAVLEFNGCKAYLSLENKNENGQMELLEMSELTPVPASGTMTNFGEVRPDKVIEDAVAHMQLVKEGANPNDVRRASTVASKPQGMGL